MNIAAPAEQRALPPRAILMVALVGLLCVGSIAWRYAQVKSELLAMPSHERQSLYERTLSTLRTTCVHADGTEMRDYCQEQATFVSRFPECDAACQSTCQRYRPKPTK
jgi:cytochrome b pre-mRNA-processing protein 3